MHAKTEFTFSKPGSSISYGRIIGEDITEARRYARQLRLAVVEIRENGAVVQVITNNPEKA